MSAREDILNRLAGRLDIMATEKCPDGISRQNIAAAKVKGYLDNPQKWPRPIKLAEDCANQEKMLQLFCKNALNLQSTVERLSSLDKLPAAAAAYCQRYDLPKTVTFWPEYSQLPWPAHGFSQEKTNSQSGVTGVFCAIAETGSLLLCSSTSTPATTSLLPETHFAVVKVDRIVLSLEEAWQLVRSELGQLPRNVKLISGPSRTADIEQTMVIGAHGPYRVHVFLVE